MNPDKRYLSDTPLLSRSPKAGYNKAGRSDFRNQRFKPDVGKMRKMRKVPLTSGYNKGLRRFHRAKNTENANTKTHKMRKTRPTGFHVTVTDFNLIDPHIEIPLDLACADEVWYLPCRRGISAILVRCHMKTRQNAILSRVLRDMGGISHWATKPLQY